MKTIGFMTLAILLLSAASGSLALSRTDEIRAEIYLASLNSMLDHVQVSEYAEAETKAYKMMIETMKSIIHASSRELESRGKGPFEKLLASISSDVAFEELRMMTEIVLDAAKAILVYAKTTNSVELTKECGLIARRLVKEATDISKIPAGDQDPSHLLSRQTILSNMERARQIAREVTEIAMELERKQRRS